MAKRRGRRKPLKPRSELIPNNNVKRIPLNDEMINILEHERLSSHILESRLFPYMEEISMYEWCSKVVDILRTANIDEYYIYAFVKTQRLVTKENMKFLDEDEIQEWEDFCDEYYELKEINENLIEDALDNLSREIQCPILSRDELEALFDLRNFHPILVEKCKEVFINDHMKEAVINGILAILNEIKEETGRVDLDGCELIDLVFSPNNPILKTSSYDLGDDTEQQGVHLLFRGFVLAIRNQFLHRDIYLENPLIAIEYLSFINFLFTILDTMTLKKEP